MVAFISSDKCEGPGLYPIPRRLIEMDLPRSRDLSSVPLMRSFSFTLDKEKMVTETVRANRRLSLLDELPPCAGPKLRAFPNRRPKIQWLQQLERSPESELGSQGYVFRVLINSQTYVIKVVGFFLYLATISAITKSSSSSFISHLMPNIH